MMVKITSKMDKSKIRVSMLNSNSNPIDNKINIFNNKTQPKSNLIK